MKWPASLIGLMGRMVERHDQKKAEKRAAIITKFATELDASIYMGGGYRGNPEGCGGLHHLVDVALDCTDLELREKS